MQKVRKFSKKNRNNLIINILIFNTNKKVFQKYISLLQVEIYYISLYPQ